MDGTLDPRFGTAGMSTTTYSGTSYMHGMTVDAQSRLVVVGHTNNGTELGDLTLARYWQ